jgi:hypothetical protein
MVFVRAAPTRLRKSTPRRTSRSADCGLFVFYPAVLMAAILVVKEEPGLPVREAAPTGRDRRAAEGGYGSAGDSSWATRIAPSPVT